MQNEVEEVLEALLEDGVKSNGQEKFLTGLQILEKLGSNILQNLKEEKFRTIKKSNATISKKLLSLPEADTLLSLLGFVEEGEVYRLSDSEIDKLFRTLPVVIFSRRLLEAKKQGPEAYEQELAIVKRQKVNSRKQRQEALAKKALQASLDYDKQERLKMEISYAKSRPLGQRKEKV